MDPEPGTSKECEKENIPAILNVELFVIKNTDGNKVTAQCEVCNSKHKKTMIKGTINTTSNFRIHLKVNSLYKIIKNIYMFNLFRAELTTEIKDLVHTVTSSS